jgi:hypothetical protein
VADVARYRVLDYEFSISAPDRPVATYIERALGGFATTTPFRAPDPEMPNVPARYTLVHRVTPTGADAYDLLHGESTLRHDVTLAAVLNHLLWHVNAEAMRQSGSFFMVHAGAVTTPDGRAVVLPATGGSGKSTLVAALVRDGFGYLSDEAAAIDPVTGRIHPFAKALTLKEGSFGLFPDLAPLEEPFVRDLWHVPAVMLRPGCSAPPTPPSHVVAIRYQPGADTEVRDMTAGEACVEVARHALSLRTYRARSLLIISRLAAAVETFAIRYGDLGDAVRTVRQLTS